MKRVALLAVLAAAPALAQDRPATLPTRDVDVTYRATQGDRAFEQRWRYRAQDEKLRLDLPSPGAYVIADQRAHSATMVSDAARSVFEMPLPNADLAGVRPGQSFARLGTVTLGGLSCTEWQAKDIQGLDVIVCFTADGVMLRARHGEQLIVEATKVSYGPVDPAVLTVPAGYKRESLPARR